MTDTSTAQVFAPSFVPVGERAQQLDMLLHLQEFSSMVVLLTGSASVGKTALLEAAYSELQIHHQVILIPAHKMMGESDLFQHLAEALDCSPSEAGVGVALNVAKNQDETVHVLVDDAHLMEAEALQYLVEVAISKNGWHLILAGDEGLESQLRILQARVKQESLYHTLHLHSLSEEELQFFLTEIYRQLGYDTLPLSQQRIHQLWMLSDGLPGKVIDYIEVENEKATGLVARIPFGHVAAMLVVGAALFFSYVYQGENVDAQDPIAALLSHSTPDAEMSVQEADDRLNALLKGKAVPTSAGVEKASIELVDIPVQSLAENSQLAVPSAEVEKQSEPAKNLSTKKDVVALVDEAPLSNERAAKQSVPVAVESKHPLLAASPKTYALQLLGVRKSKSAEAFMERLTKQVDAQQVSIYETRYKSAPWYVVVYGPFDNKNKARQAVKSLPKTMQKQRPWVRQLSKIQEDIRKAKLRICNPLKPRHMRHYPTKLVG